MGSVDKCGLQFFGEMLPKTRELFCKLSKTASPYTEKDFDVCSDAKFVGTENGTYKWVFDVEKYGLHPAEIWSDGKIVALSKQQSDSRNVLAVSYIRTATNGDANRFFDSAAMFGNLYFIMTPGRCLPWSPMIPVREGEEYREVIAQITALTSRDADRNSVGCADDISDYKEEGAHIIAILPGQGATDVSSNYPGGKKKQCEFVLQNTEIAYVPEKLIFDADSTSHPAFKDKKDFCVRIMASQSWGSDPVLLQFPINTDEIMKAGEVVYFAHDAERQAYVWRGSDIKDNASLFVIGLTILTEVDFTTWGQ